MIEYRAADIVASRCGRDMGRLFAVVRTENDYLFLADGKLRKIETPKKKKMKHVCFKAHGMGETAEKLISGAAVQNSELRRLLSEYDQLQNAAD